MADFEWQGNSKEVFDKLVTQPPMPMRPMVKKSLVKFLTKECGEGGKVETDHLVAAVKATTPPPFVKNALKSVEGLI